MGEKIQDTEHTVKGTNTRIIGVPEKEEREWAETVFEETGLRIF